MSEHSDVTGKSPHQVARADLLRKITDADMVRGGDQRSARAPSRRPRGRWRYRHLGRRG
jgi:hypothetical protein